MQVFPVIAAAAAAWLFGAAWYMALAKPWMAAAGLSESQARRRSPAPFILAFVCLLLVAGMVRHLFAMTGIATAEAGLTAGLGLGLFVAVPWIATGYAFANRPATLTLIDGGYAAAGTAVIGLVLTLV
jgi:hypothetical protein